MNDIQFSSEMNERIIAWMDTVYRNLDGAKDFALDQLPDVFQQYITWLIVQPLVPLVPTLLFAGLAYYFAKKIKPAIKVYKEEREIYMKPDSVICPTDWSEGWICALCISSLLFVISFGFTAAKSFVALHALLAPKHVILEYILRHL